MGYCMSQESSKFFISKESRTAACKAVQALGATCRYAWVNMSFVKDKSLRSVLKKWCWGTEVDGEGNIIEISFEGEKLGDDELLFETLAPFVKDGSYIEMLGEDGAHWRYCFEDGKLKTRYGRVVYE